MNPDIIKKFIYKTEPATPKDIEYIEQLLCKCKINLPTRCIECIPRKHTREECIEICAENRKKILAQIAKEREAIDKDDISEKELQITAQLHTDLMQNPITEKLGSEEYKNKYLERRNAIKSEK